MSLAQSTAQAPDEDESSFKSYDYRAGLAVGATVAKLAAPFVFARYFGAGTRWESVGKGKDAYRYHSEPARCWPCRNISIFSGSSLLSARSALLSESVTCSDQRTRAV
jgi:hypothetical protein